MSVKATAGVLLQKLGLEPSPQPVLALALFLQQRGLLQKLSDHALLVRHESSSGLRLRLCAAGEADLVEFLASNLDELVPPGPGPKKPVKPRRARDRKSVV